MKYLVVDSGTTNSRVRLYEEAGVIYSVVKAVGARNTAVSGNNEALRVSLREAIDEILKANNVVISEITAIIASGMISSNSGLAEIPHIPAPAGLQELSEAIVSRVVPEISDKNIYFIPGIKTGFLPDDPLEEKDMMRGEEAEIFGCLKAGEEKGSGEILFMHFGSHHKCIKVHEGKITACRTAITGELLMTISQDTILKSSLLPLNEVIADMQWVKKGIYAAENSGTGRALFSARVLDVMEKRSKNEITNFYLGVMVFSDLELILPMVSPKTKRIVLYGRRLFPSLTVDILRERFPEVDIVVLTEEQSDMLSAAGAVKIFENYLHRTH